MKLLNFIISLMRWNRRLEERLEKKAGKFLIPALIIAVLIIIMAWGVKIRLNFSYPHYLETNNVASYYYSKSEILFRTGSFPKIDRRDRAGNPYKENAPPGLAYFTAGLFKIGKNLFPELGFRAFAGYFPVIIFALWGLSGLAIIYDLTGKKIFAGLFFVLMLALTPVSIELTRLGNYFEEVLGVWLLFLAVWSITKIGGKWHWTAISGLLLTALSLTWQQFPVFYAVSFAILALEPIIKNENRKKFSTALLTVLIAPLIIGEAIAHILGIAYSPVSMLKELWISMEAQKDPALAWVMKRSDWRNFNIGDFIKSFGYFGTALIVLGFFELSKNFLKKRAARVFLAFGTAAIILQILFVKERYLALGILLYFFVFGARLILKTPALNNLHFLKKALYAALEALKKFKPFFALFSAILAITILFYAAPFKNSPPPEPVITVTGIPEKWEIGKTYKITARIENSGGNSLNEKEAFGGLHIEVTNAKVENISASSPFTKGVREAFKDYAQWGNAYFFETVYPRLKNKEYGEVKFSVTPEWLPVQIYYRGWLPGSCSIRDRKTVIKELFPEWQKSSSGWRSENCIKRAPANDNTEEEPCRVPVMAAHKEPIPYRCFVK